MERTDSHRFVTALAYVCETFSKDTSKAMAEAYYLALEDLGIDAIELACREACKSCEYFPRPVHLRQLACGGKDAPKLKAIEAWHAMVRIVDGPHGVVVSRKNHATDEVANKAISMLGPMTKTEDWEGPWAMKRFVETYELLDERETARKRLAPMRAGSLLTDGRG